MMQPYKKDAARQTLAKQSSNKQSNPDQLRSLVQKLLSHPEFFPDEFKSWISRWLSGNVNFAVDVTQLPPVESWKEVGGTGNAQFQNSWVNFGGANATAAYYKDPFGIVHLKGTVKSGTVGTVIFTLPAGYRPQQAEIFVAANNAAFGLVTVSPDGTVTQSGGASNVYHTLSGITFRAYS